MNRESPLLRLITFLERVKQNLVTGSKIYHMHNIKLRATLPNDKKEETSQNINNQFIA
jgi:hypothetical protein